MVNTRTKKKKTKNDFEARLFKQIKKSGRTFRYEGTKIAYVLARHYVPDFIVDTPSGTLYIEAKGYLRPEHKAKMVAVKKQHPELDIRIVFYANKAKDNRWAERHGFRYAHENIPAEWLNGL